MSRFSNMKYENFYSAKNIYLMTYAGKTLCLCYSAGWNIVVPGGLFTAQAQKSKVNLDLAILSLSLSLSQK